VVWFCRRAVLTYDLGGRARARVGQAIRDAVTAVSVS
jgi:hypothetical protein